MQPTNPTNPGPTPPIIPPQQSIHDQLRGLSRKLNSDVDLDDGDTPALGRLAKYKNISNIDTGVNVVVSGASVSLDESAPNYEYLPGKLKSFLNSREEELKERKLNLPSSVARANRLITRVGGEVRPRILKLKEDVLELEKKHVRSQEEIKKLEKAKARLISEVNNSIVLIGKQREEIKRLREELESNGIDNDELISKLNKEEGEVEKYATEIRKAEAELVRLQKEGEEAAAFARAWEEALRSEESESEKMRREVTEHVNREFNSLEIKAQVSTIVEDYLIAMSSTDTRDIESTIESIIKGLRSVEEKIFTDKGVSSFKDLPDEDKSIIKSLQNFIFSDPVTDTEGKILRTKNLKDKSKIVRSDNGLIKRLLKRIKDLGTKSEAGTKQVPTSPQPKPVAPPQPIQMVKPISVDVKNKTEPKIASSETVFSEEDQIQIVDHFRYQIKTGKQNLDTVNSFMKRFPKLRGSAFDKMWRNFRGNLVGSTRQNALWEALTTAIRAKRVNTSTLSTQQPQQPKTQPKTQSPTQTQQPVQGQQPTQTRAEDEPARDIPASVENVKENTLEQLTAEYSIIMTEATKDEVEGYQLTLDERKAYKKILMAKIVSYIGAVGVTQISMRLLTNTLPKKIKQRQKSKTRRDSTGKVIENDYNEKEIDNPEYRKWEEKRSSAIKAGDDVVINLRKILDKLDKKEKPWNDDVRHTEYQESIKGISTSLSTMNKELEDFKNKVEGNTFNPIEASSKMTGYAIEIEMLKIKIDNLPEDTLKAILEKDIRRLKFLHSTLSKKVETEYTKKIGQHFNAESNEFEEKKDDITFLNGILYNTYGLTMHHKVGGKEVVKKVEDYKKESGDLLFSSTPVFQMLNGVDNLLKKYGERKWFTTYPHDDGKEQKEIGKYIQALELFARKLKSDEVEILLKRFSLANMNPDHKDALELDAQGITERVRNNIKKAFDLDRIQDSMSKQVLEAKENKTMWLTGNPSPKERLLAKGLTEDDIDFVFNHFKYLNEEGRATLLEYIPTIRNTPGNGRITQLNKLLEERSMYANAMDRLKGKTGYKTNWCRSYYSSVSEVKTNRMDNIMFTLRNQGARLKDQETAILTPRGSEETIMDMVNNPNTEYTNTKGLVNKYGWGKVALCIGVAFVLIAAVIGTKNKLQDEVDAKYAQDVASREANKKAEDIRQKTLLDKEAYKKQQKELKTAEIDAETVEAKAEIDAKNIKALEGVVAQDDGSVRLKSTDKGAIYVLPDYGIAGQNLKGIEYILNSATDSMERKNNFANLKGKDGNYLGFNTPADGAAAAFHQLVKYTRGTNNQGIDRTTTLKDMLKKYAGLSDNNDDYIKNVETIFKRLGRPEINRNTILGQTDQGQLLQAISELENRHYYYDSKSRSVKMKDGVTAASLQAAKVAMNYGYQDLNYANYKLNFPPMYNRTA